MRKLCSLLFVLISAALVVHAQGSTLPAATVPATNLTITLPSAATGGGVYRCTGTAASCTTSSANWNQISTVTAGQNYSDSTGAAGTSYCYTVVATTSALTASPSNIYCGTPTPPLAVATISGATS